jgi:hypothetical protein
MLAQRRTTQATVRTPRSEIPAPNLQTQAMNVL